MRVVWIFDLPDISDKDDCQEIRLLSLSYITANNTTIDVLAHPVRVVQTPPIC